MFYILCFFAYSFLGWVCECIYCSIPAKKFINRGFLEGPYCPIYGCGAMLVIYLLTPFAAKPLLLFVAGILVTSALEYITSWLMEMFFHTKWWDYSTYPFNINGRICLKNSTLFGIMVVFVYYVLHPFVNDSINLLPHQAQAILCILLIILFTYDGVSTLMALLRKNTDFLEVENSMKELVKEFKTAQIFPLEEPISESIRRVLDSTDADEILLSHIQKVHDMVDSLHQKRKHTHERLSKAFPNKKEALSRTNIEALFKTMHHHLHR